MNMLAEHGDSKLVPVKAVFSNHGWQPGVLLGPQVQGTSSSASGSSHLSSTFNPVFLGNEAQFLEHRAAADQAIAQLTEGAGDPEPAIEVEDSDDDDAPPQAGPPAWPNSASWDSTW